MMGSNARAHHHAPLRNRRSLRLKGYDYTRAGAYFVSVCTHNRTCLFGQITDGQMVLNDAGRVAAECWNNIPFHFPHAALDAFVVMPNHVHGILFIVDAPVGAKNLSPLQSFQKPCGTSGTIGSMIRGFKIGVTKWMRQNTKSYKIWQRNYYERIIRNEDELNRIREYIFNNPMNWELDRDHPDVSILDRSSRQRDRA